jgi:DNA ligase (NAD+)
MALFELEDVFIGLTDSQFLSAIGKLDKKGKENLYTKAKDRYYDGDPIMSDHQFDTLEEDLKRIGSKVIHIVGGGDSTASTASMGKLIHKHLSPMLSLSKVQVNDETKFPMADIVSSFKGVWPLEASAKYDGNAVELQYANGQLIKAITRGKNGLGKDITEAMKLLVPFVIQSNKTLEIRGEVCMLLKPFREKYHMVTGVGAQATYSNARNMVGGILNDDSIPEEKINDCVFAAYSLKAIDVDGSVRHVMDAMENLKKLGFNSKYEPPLITVNSPKDILAAYETFKQYRIDTVVQLDGIVFKMPENMRTRFGENNHHPKWALALKFPAKTATTRLIFHPPYGVEWNVGPTGDLSPVGILESVDLDGSMVSRVSLYNKGKMEERGLFAGAVVEIKKSGDIIPAIIKVITPSPRRHEFVTNQNYYPTNCPACNSVLVIDRQHIRCVNFDCVAQKSRQLNKSLAALGIKGIGESTCTDLYNIGVKDIFDFFDEDKMNEVFMTQHQGGTNANLFVQGRSLDIILNASKSVKKVDLDKVILSLGISRVGTTISKQLARMYAGISYSFDGLESAVVDPFKIDSSQENNLVKKLVQVLRNHGIDIIMPKDVSTNAINFEMTGKTADTDYKTKEELLAFLVTKGYAHSPIKNAKLLLTDSHASTSGKMKIAKAKGIQILTYTELLEKLA